MSAPFVAQVQVRLLLQSSGKRYGPQEQDLAFDASSLPNPSQAARQGTGLSSKLQQDFFHQEGVQQFFDDVVLQVEALYKTSVVGDPEDQKEDGDYDEEGCRIKVVGICCEFGKHRSVALVERLAVELRARGIVCTVVHHDIETQKTLKNQQRARAHARDRKHQNHLPTDDELYS